MTKIIGLTGGIGSGKTTIAQYFKSLGVPVYIADDEAKKLLDNSAVKKKIKEIFGEFVFENNTIYKTLKTLEPKETQHYQLILYWNKERYFKSEENEYYLEASSKYTIEIAFSTHDFDYLYFDSTEGFDYDKSLFFNSENVSNKMSFHFDE